MKNILFLVVLLVNILPVQATTYYTTGTGSWNSNIWSSVGTNAAGGSWTAVLAALADGDVLVIDDAIDLDGAEINLEAFDIKVNLLAELSIEKKLRLSEDSTVDFSDDGSIIGTGPGNSEKVSFGGDNVWTGNDGLIPGPGTFDKDFVAGGGNPLPIVLAFFKAIQQDEFIDLSWQTVSEENNDYYTLERSSNGINFQELTTVNGAGNSIEVMDYSYQDNNPFQGVSYYRLRQTDYDGTSEIFQVIAAEYYGNSAAIKVVQTLGRGNDLLIHNNLDEENIAYIYDMAGRGGIIGSLKMGENYVDLKQFNMLSGIYTLRVVNVLGKILGTQKFVIQ
jgi:hypothetical protein